MLAGSLLAAIAEVKGTPCSRTAAALPRRPARPTPILKLDHDRRVSRPSRSQPSGRRLLGTLPREAAHGLVYARKLSDTSRQGRCHNRRHATLA